MPADDLAKKLHDKYSRGETPTAREQKQLERWYARMDIAESKSLKSAPRERNLTALQEQIDAALLQLTVVTKRIQEVAAENETLRREIASLRRQLSQQYRTQPA
ncbi:MAG: hypothetical protein DPW18_09930 [Chloroflexi bacterium]|nr:hypothetical protein [Chloroflexota bacterium]MDL1942573.1 DNA replication initiation control protein YabA [Chloroflexi bacterium CFX2]